MKSPVTQDAVIRNFEILGEAAKHVSEAIQQAHPEIPWRRIAGFRDVLIHNYMGVDLNEVREIIERSLPELQRNMQAILKKLGVTL